MSIGIYTLIINILNCNLSKQKYMSQTLYNILKKYSYIHRRRDLRINKSNGNVNNDTDDNNNTLIGYTL